MQSNEVGVEQRSASQRSAINSLKQYTTCDVSDALVKLGDPRGGFLPGLVMWSPYTPHHLEPPEQETRIVGEAFTVMYAPADDPRSKVSKHYIDEVPANAVLFISSPTPLSHADIEHCNAVYGGLMSTRAQKRGAAGSVVDGRIRDIGEHRALGFPVFARGIGTAPPAPLLKVVSINDLSSPLTFPYPPFPPSPTTSPPQDPLAPSAHAQTQTLIHPGDVIIGDINGVVCVPAALIERVVELIPAQVEADEQMARAIKDGMGFVEASKKFRGK